MSFEAFVRAQLPEPPARVLEVGCGGGELARSIAALDYRVTAIDPEAPAGDLFQRASLEAFADPSPFDAVIANRSLHHIDDLGAAVAKIHRLLRPRGRVIVGEHAWERMDERTARWFLERHAAIHDHPSPRSASEWMAKWEQDHAGLHGYDDLRRELDRHFTERLFVWTPYLYGELGDVTEEEEATLIYRGAIAAIGFRYVGERSERAEG
jgi:SAM-dependent methyltransferase